MTTGVDFEREIREQPVAMARLLDRGRTIVEEAAHQIRSFAPTFAVVAARGSSDNAGRYAQYLFGVHHRLAVSLATPSLFTLYGTPPAIGRALVVAVSQSGQSPDIVAVVDEGRRQGALTIAMTNDPDSPLARASAICLPLLAGEERAVAASKTYTNQLLGLAMLAAALEGAPGRWQELAGVPAWVEATLASSTPAAVRTAIAPLVAADRCVVLGRGFNYSTAFEIALKISETSQVVAHPHSPADFRHGPVAVVGRGLSAVVVAPSGHAYADAAAAVDLIAERHGAVVAISDRAELLARAQTGFLLPPGVPEWLSPLVAVVPGQLCALELARARGLDPDRPAGLSKLTLTR